MIEALPPEEPLRAVRSFKVIPHPTGKFIVIVTYECGHAVWWWRRRELRRPPRPRPCTSCWLDASQPQPPRPTRVDTLLRSGRALVVALQASGLLEVQPLVADLDVALAALGG